jgi:hypothetical protein
VTAVFGVPVTDAENCSVDPAVTDTLVGVTLTATTGTTFTFADADLVGSATLVAKTLTVAGAGATTGPAYTAVNRFVESVPHAVPLQPAPLKLQFTAVFEVPLTLAVKSCVPVVGTAALVGLMPRRITARIVKLAEADLVGSATLVAVIETIGGKGAVDGDTYRPFGEIVPHVTPEQPVPVTVQTTAAFVAPVTLAANC